MALLMAEHRLSQRHACKPLEVDRLTYRYEPCADRNAKLGLPWWRQFGSSRGLDIGGYG